MLIGLLVHSHRSGRSNDLDVRSSRPLSGPWKSQPHHRRWFLFLPVGANEVHTTKEMIATNSLFFDQICQLAREGTALRILA